MKPNAEVVRLKELNARNAQVYAERIAAAEEHMRKAWARTRELEELIVSLADTHHAFFALDRLIASARVIKRERAAEDPMRVESVWAERERKNR